MSQYNDYVATSDTQVLLISLTQVEYTFMNMKKVDYICSIFGQRVGVSVTRAMSYPDPKNFNADTAVALLRKKLFGLVSSLASWR